jgi:hypothetical protein
MIKIVFIALLFFCIKTFAKIEGEPFSKEEIEKVEKIINDHFNDRSLSKSELKEVIDLKILLQAGKRSILWFEKVNSTRSPENKLDLTVKGSSKGIPLDDPLFTNTVILTDRFNLLMRELNPLVTSIIASSTELPSSLPVSDLEFIKIIRSFDVVYQHTIRWGLARENLSWYINRSLWDVRGYLFLKATPDLENKLSNWKSLTDSEKVNFKSWLLGVCHNADFDENDCYDTLTRAIKRGNALPFYQKVVSFGEEMYQSFFQVSKTRTRPEIFWNKEKTLLTSPFLLPERLDVKNWLTENVQDAWSGPQFNFQLQFLASSENPIPHIEFKSGTGAHVDRIGGDTITIDADHSINNYAQRWSIRHEYGHILGFPDCYLEFYDVNIGAMVYYEIDIDNIMCSRHGSVQNEHITKLKTVYP